MNKNKKQFGLEGVNNGGSVAPTIPTTTPVEQQIPINNPSPNLSLAPADDVVTLPDSYVPTVKEAPVFNPNSYQNELEKRYNEINQNFQNQTQQTQMNFNDTARQIQEMMMQQQRANQGQLAQRGLAGSGIEQQVNSIAQQNMNSNVLQAQNQMQQEMNNLSMYKQQAEQQQQAYVRSLQEGDYARAWQEYNAYQQSAEYASTVTAQYLQRQIDANKDDPKALKEFVEQFAQNQNLSQKDYLYLEQLVQQYINEPTQEEKTQKKPAADFQARANATGNFFEVIGKALLQTHNNYFQNIGRG